MKSLLLRSLLVLGLLGATAVGCGGMDEGEVDEGVTDTSAITAQPICADLVVHEVQTKFCGFQTGPLDDSPVTVRCERTCVTDRYISGFLPPPGGAQCGTGDTTCSAWECPSCD